MNKNFIDLTNQEIGRLKFIEFERRNKQIVWKTLCQCGNETWIRAAYISLLKGEGRRFECSKCRYERKSPTLTDKVFGRLTVLNEVPSKTKDRMWLVRCECGVEKEIKSSSLIRKRKPTRSCGCLARKLASRWVNTTQYPPLHGLRSKNADIDKLSLYHARNAFVAACYRTDDSRYNQHGAIGHTVCELWRNGAKDFVKWAVKNGYKKGYGIYLRPGKTEFSPKNCFIQSRSDSHKTTNSKFITWKGKTQSISQWSKELGCSVSCLSQRLKKYKEFDLDKIMNLEFVKDKKHVYGTEHYENDIVKLYKEGKTYQEIRNEIGCEFSTIKRFLKKNNIEIRKPQTRSSLEIKKKMNQVHELFLRGKSYLEISKLLDMKYGSMTYHHRKYLSALP